MHKPRSSRCIQLQSHSSLTSSRLPRFLLDFYYLHIIAKQIRLVNTFLLIDGIRQENHPDIYYHSGNTINVPWLFSASCFVVINRLNYLIDLNGFAYDFPDIIKSPVCKRCFISLYFIPEWMIVATSFTARASQSNSLQKLV